MKPTVKYPILKHLLKLTLAIFGILTLIITVLGIMLYHNLGDLPDESRFAHLPYYQNGQFVNLYTDDLPYYPEKATGQGGFVRYDGYTPNGRLPMVNLHKSDFGQPENFAYYWLGHASAILELDGQRFLIDPVFDNANPLNLPLIAPRFQEAPIGRKDLPQIDVVLISHDHYDHLEATTIRYLADKAKRFIAPLGVGARLQSWGVSPDKITELGWGDNTMIGTIQLTAEPTQHYSSRWTNDRNKTLWASFVFEGSKRLYWSGDTGYAPHFADIGKKYGEFDLAFMEIDAANAGWPKTHMFAHQSVQASLDLNAKKMVPIHWGVFSLGRNPWYESIDNAVKSANEHNLAIDILKMGEKYQDGFENNAWWQDEALRQK
ncbi:MBL fold metallo-hydrolase [Mannheimia sp. AT1]|uniref:MBL fold metallo-hydrolase n=1 Tax=Mannheimia cairinae TaxID=3025936 RepID=A0ABT5MNK1_9PAST|nr:MBL fold metallo-hydrolase [Mannheimia cairinae]MDD0823044.1 MBL fold metallo-hydrolase [Mannheimia cairinae]MDD0825931.1 MBL fold metallo-hydrolase [Mannheimia cairinae]